MKKYLVGGALRDRLLGLPVTDRDWVVVGSTVEQMLEQGYLAVGKDFPIFLHPQTREEYALARTERKVAKGYHGFTFHASADVSLEEDLARRDLTLNAIAEDEQGQLIDPFGGQADIKQRVLRHVTEAFAEDPVRILRVARLRARFAAQQFTVAASTMELMRAMVDNGEADALVAERVWQETDKALGCQHPQLYFETLSDCGALNVIFPELVNDPAALRAVQQASTLSTDNSIRFAALCHNMEKGNSRASATADNTFGFCKRLRVPGNYRDLAVLVARFYLAIMRAPQLTATELTDTLVAVDVLRKPARFMNFLQTCEAVALARTEVSADDVPAMTTKQSRRHSLIHADFWLAAKDTFLQVDAANIAVTIKNPQLIGQQVYNARLAAIQAWMGSF